MLKHCIRNRALWLANAFLALVAALTGVIRPEIYAAVVPPEILPGVITQDMVVIFSALFLLALAFTTHRGEHRKQLAALGVLGFFSYAYGIYAIEQVYTRMYLVYLALLGLSFFSLVYGLACIQRSDTPGFHVPRRVRYLAAGYGFFVALLFTGLWMSRLVPLLRSGQRIEYQFSIFIIDLCFIMPAFVISGVLALQEQLLGLVSLPALFILGVGILSPLALGEVVRALLFGLPFRAGEFWLYLALTLFFLAFTGLYLAYFRRVEKAVT